jgi:PUA domain protein
VKKIKRYTLREKDKRLFLNELPLTFKTEVEHLLKIKNRIEVVELKKFKIILIDGVPLIAESMKCFFPILLSNKIFSLPKIIVNMGAVPHICNGADVMAPGIVEINGNFKEEDLVLVLDEKHGKPLAIGSALFNSESVFKFEKGKILRNLHYVNDEIWKTIKTLKK